MVFTIKNISTSTAPMTRLEAEEITEAIQGNFNSLGNMLETARNRKAWKVLGYRDFEGYCNNEFGKSQRRAYELIAEAAIAQSLKEADPSLRLPAQSNLKILKELPIEQQLEAVKRSEWLATESNKKKPDRSDLLIAIDEMSGARSGDMRASLEARGFIKGVEVATTRGVNIGSRGVITKVDKTGEIHVELHAGGKTSLDATSCRILSANEKPEKRAWFGTTDIGDKVLIFSKGLENILGTIKTRLTSEKIVGVEVSGQVLKLPYAELEVVEIEIDKPDQDSWLQNFIWTDFGAQWCYDSESQTITTVYPCLRFHPTEKCKGSPADWLKRWVGENSLNLAIELLPNQQVLTLLQTKLITCEEAEKSNFAESIIAGVWKMSLPDECRKQLKALIADKAKGISFGLVLPELLSGQKTQTRRAWQDDYARSFLRYYEEGTDIPALDKGQHRGGQEIGKIRLTERPYQQMLSEMPVSDLVKEGGMCATVQEFIDRFFEGKDKLVWVLDFEFIASDSSEEVALLKQRLEEAEQVISQLIKCQQSVADTAIVDTAIVDTVDTAIVNTVDTAIVDTAIVDTAIVDTTEKLQQEIDHWRAEITNQLQDANYDVTTTDRHTTTGGRARKRKTNLENRLSEIETLQNLRIGQIVSERDWPGVTKTCPGGWGEILALGFIWDGIPQAWVKWNGVELPDHHPIRTLKTQGDTVMTASPLDAPETSGFLVESNTSTASILEFVQPTDFLPKNTYETSTAEDTQTDWHSILASNNFTPNYHHTDDCTEEYRGWTIYLDPNGGYNYIDLTHPGKGAFCCDTHFLSVQFQLEGEDEIIKWAKEIVNQVEDSCPSQLWLELEAIDHENSIPRDTAAQTDFSVKNNSKISVADSKIIATKREKIAQNIKERKEALGRTNDEKKRKKLKSTIRGLEGQLEDLDKFEQFQLGDTVTKTRFPEKRGTLHKLELTETGMPLASVEWVNEYGEINQPESHPLGVLTNLSLGEK